MEWIWTHYNKDIWLKRLNQQDTSPVVRFTQHSYTWNGSFFKLGAGGYWSNSDSARFYFEKHIRVHVVRNRYAVVTNLKIEIRRVFISVLFHKGPMWPVQWMAPPRREERRNKKKSNRNGEREENKRQQKKVCFDRWGGTGCKEKGR